MFTVESSLTLPPLNGAAPRERALVATLLYYDLFSFPLRGDEVVRFAHPGASPQLLALEKLPPKSEWWDSANDSDETFWFLQGRTHLLARRAQLASVSQAKLARARKYARRLQLIPGVRFVGITGSLAMESAVPNDDIDFLIITAPNRLWQTRALVLAALLSWGVKRPDDGKGEYPDLICANIFLDETDLRIPDENLFIAHEICQMMPLLGESTYRAFVQANSWARGFLPQWQPAPLMLEDHPAWRRVQATMELAFANRLGARLDRELGARQLQRIHNKHARGHNPNIKITPTQLRFHARDLSDYVVNTFNTRWQALNAH